MTNKSLSEQICEVCGIEPYYGLKVYTYDDDGRLINCELVTDKRKYRLIADLRGFANVDDEDFKDIERKYFPDFENNNNNFVKLLEIVSKKASVSFCHNGTYYGCSIHYFFKDIFEAVEGNLQHNFLNTLLVQDLRNPCKPSLLEQIKQAIREADWEV